MFAIANRASAIRVGCHISHSSLGREELYCKKKRDRGGGGLVSGHNFTDLSHYDCCHAVIFSQQKQTKSYTRDNLNLPKSKQFTGDSSISVHLICFYSTLFCFWTLLYHLSPKLSFSILMALFFSPEFCFRDLFCLIHVSVSLHPVSTIFLHISQGCLMLDFLLIPNSAIRLPQDVCLVNSGCISIHQAHTHTHIGTARNRNMHTDAHSLIYRLSCTFS